MGLLKSFLRTEATSCMEQGVRIEVIGRRDRLPPRVQDAIAALTAGASTPDYVNEELAVA